MKCDFCDQEIDPAPGAIHLCPAFAVFSAPFIIVVAICFAVLGMLGALMYGLSS